MACELTDGLRPLPGGLIHRTDHWVVEHCVGPLGLGTLIVKPVRHTTALADLSDDEAAELGPLLRDAARVATELMAPVAQVYTCLWSHAGGEPGHIHYVVQPVTHADMDRFGVHGPKLQVEMFTKGELPESNDVERIASAARAAFAGLQS